MPGRISRVLLTLTLLAVLTGNNVTMAHTAFPDLRGGEINLNFQNVNASNQVTVALRQATIELGSAAGFRLSSPMGVRTLAVTATAVSLDVQSGYAGSLMLNIAATGTPSLILTGVSGGSITVTWPTPNGPQTQLVTSGNPLLLAGYIGSLP